MSKHTYILYLISCNILILYIFKNINIHNIIIYNNHMINISIYNPSILNETKDQKNTYITSNHKQGSLKKHCTFHWTVAAVTGLQPALLCKSCEIFHKGNDFSDVFLETTGFIDSK